MLHVDPLSPLDEHPVPRWSKPARK